MKVKDIQIKNKEMSNVDMVKYLVRGMKEFEGWENESLELLILRIKYDSQKYDYYITEEEILQILKELGRVSK